MHDTDRLRANLSLAIGFVPGRVAGGHVVRTRMLEDHSVEELKLAGPNPIPAVFVRPAREGAGQPVILYCHGQPADAGLGCRELVDGNGHLQPPAYGLALANMGFSSLCIDLPGFGGRQSEQGASVGYMLNDLSRALGFIWLLDPRGYARVYTLGMSLGGALTFWLAALDGRVEGCAHLCALSDLGPMKNSGADTRLTPVLRTPQVLALCEVGDVAGLVGGPQLICHGAKDPLTPPAARDAALARVHAAYDMSRSPDGHAVTEAPSLLETFLDRDAGHVETAPMRVAVLDFLARAAKRPVFFAAE